MLCLKNIYTNQPRRLPPPASWLVSHNQKYLEQAEVLSQQISLYAWLSFKFPTIFMDNQNITLQRQQISQYITQALLLQSGYGDTSRKIDLYKTRY